MPADVHIDEGNGGGAAITHSVSRLDYLSIDSAGQNAADYPLQTITSGYKGSYDKYNRAHVVSLGGATRVKNFKIYRYQGSPTSGDQHRTTATPTTASYSAVTYATPSTALMATSASHAFPTSEPATANLGIQSSLTGEITNLASNSVTDWVRHQVQISPGTTEGAVFTIRWVWDEISMFAGFIGAGVLAAAAAAGPLLC